MKCPTSSQPRPRRTIALEQTKALGEGGSIITYEQFKELYDAIGGSPEFPVFFDEKCEDEYVIIEYDDGPTFQRCFGEGHGELGF